MEDKRLEELESCENTLDWWHDQEAADLWDELAPGYSFGRFGNDTHYVLYKVKAGRPDQIQLLKAVQDEYVGGEADGITASWSFGLAAQIAFFGSKRGMMVGYEPARLFHKYDIVLWIPHRVGIIWEPLAKKTYDNGKPCYRLLLSLAWRTLSDPKRKVEGHWQFMQRHEFSKLWPTHRALVDELSAKQKQESTQHEQQFAAVKGQSSPLLLLPTGISGGKVEE